MLNLSIKIINYKNKKIKAYKNISRYKKTIKMRNDKYKNLMKNLLTRISFKGNFIFIKWN
jgi:hypothetical protein